MIRNTLFYLILILVLNACTAPTTRKPIADDFALGEKWKWKWSRTVQGETMAEGEDLLEVVDDNGVLSFWNGFDTVAVSTSLDEKPSDSPFRDWPLKVGKKWKFENTWVNDEGTKGTTSQDVEVVAYEEFTVEAGSFMAYKIEYKGTIVNSRGFEGEVNDTWWYCPEIKKYIKHVNDDGYGMYVNELTSYSKNQ